MQTYSYSTLHPICSGEDQDIFSALIDKRICVVNPVESSKVEECGNLPFTFGHQQATNSILGSNDHDNLEPTPLVDNTTVPMFDRRSQVPEEERALRGSSLFAHQVTPTPIASYDWDSSDQIGTMFPLGRLGNTNFQLYDAILSSPAILASLSSAVQTYHTTNSILFSPHVVSPSPSSSRPAPGGNSFRDGTLQAKQEVAECATTIRRRRRKKDQILPENFVPGPYTVIIDRRKRARYAPGNQHLRTIAMAFLSEYANASDRHSKTRIVTRIRQMLEDICPDGGAFVRLGPDDRWYTVRDSVSTEKVGYTMRELLGERYRSSSMGKKIMKLQESKSSSSSDGEYDG